MLENDRIKPYVQNNHITLNRFYQVAGNRLLASTDQYGIVEWKGNDFYPINSDYTKSVEEMAMLNDSLWVVIQANSFVQVVTNQFAPYSDLKVLDVSMVRTDSRHRTWLGTISGLKLLDPIQEKNKPVRLMPLPAAFDLPVFRNTWVTDFLEDSKGNCWIATTGKGIVRINPDGRATIYSEADGLPASYINCIWEDYQNNIWVGTPLGLAKFSTSNDVRIFTPKHGLTKGATGCILPAPGNSVQLYDAQTITELNLESDSFHLVASEGRSDGVLYKVGKEELLLISKDGNKLYTRNNVEPQKIAWPGIGHSYLITHMEDDRFVALVNNNLYAISNGRVRGKLVLTSGLLFYSMVSDKKGNLWLGTFDKGVYKINCRSVKDSVYMELGDSVRKELPDQHIRILFCDKENELWIGTRYKGLFRFLQDASGKYAMQHYGVEQGLSSNFIRTINRDNKGNIWIGTPQGLDKLIAEQKEYRIFNFGKINNIYHLVQDICFLKNDYFVTEGLVLIYARDLQQDTLPPPPVYITKAAIGPATQDSAIGQAARLSYRKPQIYFEFCAPQFINEEWNEYKYRLLGSIDTNWIKATSSRSVYFASLQPGHYTFEVKVLGFNGAWGEPARYSFIVTTPFWQKGWFIALIIAAVAMLGYALYRYRIQQLIRLQQVRNQIATDLHDEIGSNLTNISILTSLSKKNIDQPQQATNFLQRISEEVASSSQSLDDIIWSVNVNHDTLEETVARMRLYAAELFDGGDIHYDLQLDPAFEKTKLIMEQRRDIYLIYKEAVNNILKHAKAKNVLIKIAMISGHQLQLYIKDDGIGFDTNKISHRHGLEGMRSRVKKWKGKMQIVSAANRGTSLDIILPLG
jgi:signal transduction histidine kinase